MLVEVFSTHDAPGRARLLRYARLGKARRLVVHCREAIEAMPLLEGRTPPEFLLVNPEVSGRGEVELLRTVRERRIPTKIAPFVPRLDSPVAVEASKLAPAALISKEIPPRFLIKTLEEASLISPASWNAGSDRGTSTGGERVTQAWLRGEPLTRREIEISKGVRAGLHDREIAQSLFVSESTVKSHLHNIYRKLSVRGRNDLTRYACERGWGHSGERDG